MTEVTKVSTTVPVESPDPLVEPLSLLATELGRIAAEIQAVEVAHLERMESVATQLRNHLREQVTAEVRKELEAQFQVELQAIRAEFEQQQIRQAPAQAQPAAPGPGKASADRRAIEMEL